MPGRADVRRNLSRQGLDGTVQLVEGFARNVAKTWERQVGLLVVDGNHLEAHEDFSAWRRHLMRGGIVVFHDSNLPSQKHASPEVTAAVERIIDEGGVEVVERLTAIAVRT